MTKQKASSARGDRIAKSVERRAARHSELEIDGKRVSLSNLDKVLYPKTGFTKGQVIDYYIRISPVLLPHLEGRPLTMKRFPNGVGGPFFYEKRCPGHRPDWVHTASVWSKTNQGGDPVLRGERSPDVGLGSQSGRSRAAYMAISLVESLTDAWDPDKYTDDYRSALLKLIHEKVEHGGKLPPGTGPKAKKPTNVIDLVSVLQESLAHTRRLAPAAKKARHSSVLKSKSKKAA